MIQIKEATELSKLLKKNISNKDKEIRRTILDRLEKEQSNFLTYNYYDIDKDEEKPMYKYEKIAIPIKKNGNIIKLVTGNVIKIHNPLKFLTFEYLPSKYEKFGALTSELADYYNCSIATSGGFYDRKTFKPEGTLISNSKMLFNDENNHNVQFGLSKSGYYVGYFNNSENKSYEKNFVQHLSGCVWLVKNGKNYVEESSKIEQLSDSGLDDLSARNSIGFDNAGILHIFQVDGKTWESGLTFNEFADSLVSYGMLNAINIDGGGSTTVVKNNEVVNALTEDCSDSTNIYKRCERRISTILCLKKLPEKIEKKDNEKDIASWFFSNSNNILLVIVLVFGLLLILSFIYIVILLFMLYNAKNKFMDNTFQIIRSDDELDLSFEEEELNNIQKKQLNEPSIVLNDNDENNNNIKFNDKEMLLKDQNKEEK